MSLMGLCYCFIVSLSFASTDFQMYMLLIKLLFKLRLVLIMVFVWFRLCLFICFDRLVIDCNGVPDGFGGSKLKDFC